jgi:hypothetical protein
VAESAGGSGLGSDAALYRGDWLASGAMLAEGTYINIVPRLLREVGRSRSSL